MSSPPLLIERRAQQAFSVTTTKAHDGRLGGDLTSLLNEAGLRSSLEDHAYMAPGADPAHLVSEVVTILGAVGGLGGIAAILKAFFGRHKGITVKFGENGEVLQADGLSVDDIIRLLDKCSPRMPPDLVVRDARDRDGSEDSSLDEIVPGEGFKGAMLEARRRSRNGPPQEVVEYVDGEHRFIRGYEDGQEMPRRPGCPPWCDRDHEDSQPGLPVKHDRMVGRITQPDGAGVYVKIVREPGSQDLVTVGGWSSSHRFGDFPSPLALPAEHAVRLADLAGVLGHADLAEHIRNAAATITAATPAAGEAGQ
jgi:hypothetical protein